MRRVDGALLTMPAGSASAAQEHPGGGWTQKGRSSSNCQEQRCRRALRATAPQGGLDAHHDQRDHRNHPASWPACHCCSATATFSPKWSSWGWKRPEAKISTISPPDQAALPAREQSAVPAGRSTHQLAAGWRADNPAPAAAVPWEWA